MSNLNKDYYVVLTGAKKNIGDFLITYRCEKLLEKIRPDRELIKLNHWENLQDNLELINRSKGIIIFGGPGYQRNMYPGTYKLVENLEDIKVPIIPLGLGWKGVPGDNESLRNYVFRENSLKLLKKIEKESPALSCRDYYTKKAISNNGFKNALMTGCPVWYDIDSLGKEMNLPDKVKRVVYTPAQDIIFKNQSVEVMKLLKLKFPIAEIYCSFHRGMGIVDEFTKEWDAKNTSYLAEEAKKIGLIPIDVSYDLKKMEELYDKCDFHVGYRVHGHIYFLSKRKPSILIHEDGRGRGVSEALNIFGVDGFERTSLGSFSEGVTIPKVGGGLRKVFPPLKESDLTIEVLERYLDEEIENGFLRFSGVDKIIDKNYKIMETFLKKLP